MENLRQFCAALTLTLLLSLSTFAGEIGMPGVKNQPSPTPQSSITGDMPCPGAAATGGIEMPGVAAVAPATGTMLSLLQSVLSFF